jgi:hypothetical protein
LDDFAERRLLLVLLGSRREVQVLNGFVKTLSIFFVNGRADLAQLATKPGHARSLAEAVEKLDEHRREQSAQLLQRADASEKRRSSQACSAGLSAKPTITR